MRLVNHVTLRWALPRESIFFGHRALEAKWLASQGLDEDHLATLLQVFDVLAEGFKPRNHIGWQDEEQSVLRFVQASTSNYCVSFADEVQNTEVVVWVDMGYKDSADV